MAHVMIFLGMMAIANIFEDMTGTNAVETVEERTVNSSINYVD